MHVEWGAMDLEGYGELVTHLGDCKRSIIAHWSWLSLIPDAPLFPAKNCFSKLPSTGVSTCKIQEFHCPSYKFFLSFSTFIQPVLDPMGQFPMAWGGWVLRYVAKPAWNSSSTLHRYLCCHMDQKTIYFPPGMSDPRSLKAMAIGGVCLAKSEKEQRINLATVPSREMRRFLIPLCLQCSIQLNSILSQQDKG